MCIKKNCFAVIYKTFFGDNMESEVNVKIRDIDKVAFYITHRIQKIAWRSPPHLETRHEFYNI